MREQHFGNNLFDQNGESREIVNTKIFKKKTQNGNLLGVLFTEK